MYYVLNMIERNTQRVRSAGDYGFIYRVMGCIIWQVIVLFIRSIIYEISERVVKNEVVLRSTKIRNTSK